MDRLRIFGFLIKDIGRLYTEVFQHEAREIGVTLADCKVLAYLSRNEGVSQIRLAELTGIDPMSLVRILDRMAADDWIERRLHPTDRRARQLYLKEKAQPALEQIWKVGEAVRVRALTGIKAEQRDLFMELLERVHLNLLERKVDTTEDKTQSFPSAAARGRSRSLQRVREDVAALKNAGATRRKPAAAKSMPAKATKSLRTAR